MISNIPFQANLNDKASVLKATEGSHTVFAVTDYWQGAGLDKNVEIQQGKNLANAAKEAGVQHFIYSSLLNIKSRKFNNLLVL